VPNVSEWSWKIRRYIETESDRDSCLSIVIVTGNWRLWIGSMKFYVFVLLSPVG